MCGLFGFLNYGLKINAWQINELVDGFATESAIRGTDAVGIAYNIDGKLEIEKEPKSAYEVTFKLPRDTRAGIGHTRHSTQGSAKKRFNNHPFKGRLTDGGTFALAHNGIIANDKSLRKKYALPETKIETDSYIAVQLLEREKELSIESMKVMVEELKGSFTFSVLDDRNNIQLVKGDNPLTLLHLTELGLYVYASTEQILWRALASTLLSEIKASRFEEVPIKEGQILSISSDGELTWGEFEYRHDASDLFDWWEYGWPCCSKKSTSEESEYVAELKSMAGAFGYTPDDIDYMVHRGYTNDEITEILYGEDGEIAFAEK
jgi:glucosamine--fructose-6-phosphate aminotransferase (isomerizing)